MKVHKVRRRNMFHDLGLPNYEFNLLNTETINADNGQ